MPQPLAPDLRRRAMQCTEEEAELHARETTSPVEDAQGIFNACGRRRLAGRQTKHKTGRGQERQLRGPNGKWEIASEPILHYRPEVSPHCDRGGTRSEADYNKRDGRQRNPILYGRCAVRQRGQDHDAQTMAHNYSRREKIGLASQTGQADVWVILRRLVSNTLELAAANAHHRHPAFIMKLRMTFHLQCTL
jgi:hypothetical protein